MGSTLKSKDEIDQSIYLGSLIHHGAERKENKIYLEHKNLNKHTFVCGVTGSGKTTTCQSLLINSNLPFLVIEPAKTEYRILAEDGCDDIYYFTLGKQDIAPFFLNPFELFRTESITSRADMIKATIISAFDMEAAMPQIIEAATYRVYEDKGWDIRTNTWINPSSGKKEDPYVPDSYAFPTLSDFIDVIEDVTKEQGFGERLESEYLGSLKARLQSLTVGAKGMMLNTPRSIDFSDLVTKKVVLELEEIKDGAEKSLIMGFVVTNLLEAIKAKHLEYSNQNKEFKHITLIEEAHRLLSKVDGLDSPNKRRGVEIFADLLAEVRKYGESLIIVDQIPNKMTPEVLKNTNTKIVHKIFAQDDKDAIGNTMALKDEQKEFLSYLDVGRAIMVTEGWKKPVQVKITPVSSTTNRPPVKENILRERAVDYYSKNNVTGVIPGLSNYNHELTCESISKYLSYLSTDRLMSNNIIKDILIEFYNAHKRVSRCEKLKPLHELSVHLSKIYDDNLEDMLSDELYVYFVAYQLKTSYDLSSKLLKNILELYNIKSSMDEDSYSSYLNNIGACNTIINEFYKIAKEMNLSKK